MPLDFKGDLQSVRDDIATAFAKVSGLVKAREKLAGSHPFLNEALLELQQQMEDLRTAHEELRVQNEGLITASESVAEERLRYKALFDYAPEALVTTDLKGKILESNMAACRMLNVNRKFLPDRVLASLIPRDYRKVFRSQFNRILKSESVTEISFFLQPHTSEMPVEFRATVMPLRYGDNSISEIRWIIDPIPLVKEDTETSFIAKPPFDPEDMRPQLGELVYTTCRSIQEPIHSIIGLTDLLREQTSDLKIPEVEEDITSISERAIRVNMLITELIEIIRIDSGWTRPNAEKIPVDEFLNELETGIQFTLQDSKFHIECPDYLKFPDNIFIAGNRVRLWQAAIKTVEIANDMCDTVSVQSLVENDYLWFNVTCNMSTEELGLGQYPSSDDNVLISARYCRKMDEWASRGVYRLMLVQRLFELLKVKFRIVPSEQNGTSIKIGLQVLQ